MPHGLNSVMCGLNFHCFVKSISSASYDMFAGIIETVVSETAVSIMSHLYLSMKCITP